MWRISAQPGHSDYLRAGARPATADMTRFINTHRDPFGVESICHTLQCRMPCVCWPAGPRPAPTTSSSLRSSTTPSRLRRSRRPTDQVNLDEPPRGTAPRPCSAQRAPRTRNTGRLRWSCSSIWSTSSPPRRSPPYMAYERRLHRGASGRDPDGGGVDAYGDAPGPRDLRAGVRRHPRRGLSSTASLAWRRHSRLKTRRRNEAAIAKLPWPTDRS